MDKSISKTKALQGPLWRPECLEVVNNSTSGEELFDTGRAYDFMSQRGENIHTKAIAEEVRELLRREYLIDVADEPDHQLYFAVSVEGEAKPDDVSNADRIKIFIHVNGKQTEM